MKLNNDSDLQRRLLQSNKIKVTMCMNKNSGFTLIEVLIVISLIGIVTTFAIPDFAKWRENQKFNSTARDVSLVLQRAKMAAINGQSNVAVIITAGTGASATYRTFVDDGVTPDVFDAGEEEIQKSTAMPDGVEIDSDVNTRFNSMGIPIGSGCTINLKKGATLTRSIEVSLAGHISLN